MRDYLPYCTTDRQVEILEAVIEAGSNQKASKILGLSRRFVDQTVVRIKKNAAKKGYSPSSDMTHSSAPGFGVKRVSTLYNDSGEVTAQWVIQTADNQVDIQELAQSFAEEIPRSKPVKKPKPQNKSLVNQYTITDYHLGMLSWHEETGDDWDTDIAENLLTDWFTMAIEMSPKADTAIFAQLGDFLHWDGLDAVTPQNKHILDADTRFQNVVRVAIRSVRRIIQKMLEKYQHVHVIMAEGNHDPASSIWLRELFKAFYDNEPRVTIDASADVYYCYEHGLTSLFYHHGHKRNPKNIDDIFAAKFRDVFGRTKYSYAHLGHLHHVDVKESNLMIVEQHRTLAAPDAFASRGGWLAGRDAKVITYHKDYGEVGRLTLNPEMVNG